MRSPSPDKEFFMNAAFSSKEQVVPSEAGGRLHNHDEIKREILQRYGVVPSERFDPKEACEKRIAYLKGFLRSTGLRGFVLGISGGVDSSTCGRLAQLACEQLRAEGYQAEFYAVRLPAGIQRDEQDAQEALRFIAPDKSLVINIGDSANELNDACLAAVNTLGSEFTPAQADYHKGNIKARLRMASQYHLAAFYCAAVIGSDHAAEAVSGFFSKFGDGAADLIVINGLNKTQVRMCAKFLGAPACIWSKAPTADLEELNPGKLDDDGFGFPYSDLDAFLEGAHIDPTIEEKIVALYNKTRHKREAIVEFAG
jgi:NAD+ synthase